MEQRQDDTLPYRRKEPSVDRREAAPNAETDVEPAERSGPHLLGAMPVAGEGEARLGEVVIRREVEEVPSRLDVETTHDEVEVEHIPVGRAVNQREEPRQEGDVLVVPVYEEQVVMVKRLVLREYVRVRRISATERQVYADTLRRDRLVVEDPKGAGPVREVYRGPEGEDLAEARPSATDGLVEWLKKALS